VTKTIYFFLNSLWGTRKLQFFHSLILSPVCDGFKGTRRVITDPRKIEDFCIIIVPLTAQLSAESSIRDLYDTFQWACERHG
jgi:hypothetical protein